MIKNVFDMDDIRRLIFTYLRKEAKKRCIHCNDVCVWDNEVKPYMETNVKQNRFNYVLCCECYELLSDNMFLFFDLVF